MDRLCIRNFLYEQSGLCEAVATGRLLPRFFIGSIVFVIFPLASFEHAAGRSVAKYLRQALRIGLAVTVLCTAGFMVLARPLVRLWNPAFLPAAGCIWMYAFGASLNGIVQMIASVELARHRYRFIGFILGPALLMCAVLYGTRQMLSIPYMIGVLIVTNVVSVGLMLWHVERTEKPAEAST